MKELNKWDFKKVILFYKYLKENYDDFHDGYKFDIEYCNKQNLITRIELNCKINDKIRKSKKNQNLLIKDFEKIKK